MARFVLVVMLAAAAGCASSNPAGTCDPQASACPCGESVTCVDGYRCDLGTGTCVADTDAGVLDAPIDAMRKGFGEPCLDKDECASEICIFVGTGGRCTRLCSGGDCPDDWGCFGEPSVHVNPSAMRAASTLRRGVRRRVVGVARLQQPPSWPAGTSRWSRAGAAPAIVACRDESLESRARSTDRPGAHQVSRRDPRAT